MSARHAVVAGRVIVRDGALAIPGVEDVLARHAARRRPAPAAHRLTLGRRIPNPPGGPYRGGHGTDPRLPQRRPGGRELPGRQGVGLPGGPRHRGLVRLSATPAAADLASIREELGLHALAVEDALDVHERPKLDRYKTHLFVAAYSVALNAAPGS